MFASRKDAGRCWFLSVERAHGQRSTLADNNEAVLTLRFGLLGHRGSEERDRSIVAARTELLTRCSELRAVSIRGDAFRASFIDTRADTTRRDARNPSRPPTPAAFATLSLPIWSYKIERRGCVACWLNCRS